MAIDRSTIIRGPAIVTFNGGTFYSKDDIKVEMGLETFNIDSSAYGKIDERAKERVAKVSFTPVGEYEHLSVLWPYGASTIGASLFTGTDLPLVIKTLAGKTITFSAAAVTKMPDVICSAVKTLIGQVEFTCLGHNNEAWTATDNLVAAATASFTDTGLSSANIITQPYVLAWGAAPFDSFQTLEGVVVNFNLGTEPVTTDSDGIVDMTFKDLSVSAKCRPLGITEAQLITAMKFQGTSNTRGKSLNTGSSPLVITGTGVVITVKGAAMKMAPMEFGAATPRVGEVEFIATRTVTSGVVASLFTVATS